MSNLNPIKMTKNYLELSQENGTAHKFYEVTVDGSTMSIRYGRIGTHGTTSKTKFGSPEIATKMASKKVKAKMSKGYEEAVMGVRKKRPISRRSIMSTRSNAKSAPVLWKFASGSAAFGIYVSDKFCWIGNEAGRVFKLDHSGNVINQYQLPDGVKCIIADDDWIYVGCDDGNVYDLTGKMPRKAYHINENVDIYWLDINNGLLGVSDCGGSVTVINYDDEEQWTKKSKGSSGWMVRCDEEGRVYHGHSAGVDCYNGHSGKNLWKQKTTGAVLFGWRNDDTALACTSRAYMELFDQKGRKTATMKADGALYSCAAAPNNEYFFGGDSSSSVYCWNKDGERLWKLATTCGSAFSMQYHNEKLYIVTTTGALTCIDASPEAIEKAQQGVLPEHVSIKAPKAVQVAPTEFLETAPNAATCVKLICQNIGGKLRVRVNQEGYNNDWNVQFPYNLRKEGAEFLVEDVREAKNGGFYRAHGNIYKG